MFWWTLAALAVEPLPIAALDHCQVIGIGEMTHGGADEVAARCGASTCRRPMRPPSTWRVLPRPSNPRSPGPWGWVAPSGRRRTPATADGGTR